MFMLANLIAVTEPVFNPVWIFFAIVKTLGTNMLIGGGIIVLAVTMASIYQRSPQGGGCYF